MILLINTNIKNQDSKQFASSFYQLSFLENLFVGLDFGPDEDLRLQRPGQAVVHAVQVPETSRKTGLLNLAAIKIVLNFHLNNNWIYY